MSFCLEMKWFFAANARQKNRRRMGKMMGLHIQMSCFAVVASTIAKRQAMYNNSGPGTKP